MQSFAYNSPTKLHFGVGVGAVADHMADELTSSGCKTALVVTGGGSVRRNGAHDAVLKALEAAGVRAVEISGIEPNPRVTSVERATALCRAEGVDLVVAVGGGSTMDASKAICAAAGHDGPAWDLGKLFKSPLLFCAPRAFIYYTGQISVQTIVQGTFEELP